MGLVQFFNQPPFFLRIGKQLSLLALLLLLPVHSAISQQPGAQAPQAVATLPVPDANGVYRTGHGVSAPKLIFSQELEFSEKARKKKISGNCTVSLVVDSKGNVIEARVIHSIAEGQPEKARSAALTLDEKALEAVRHYRFEPGTFQGKPVPVTITVDVNFQIF